jgi:sugar O-acyltransferase (sialic acid O-acetyltransferase NeuD family)
MKPLTIIGTGPFAEIAALYFETFQGRDVVSYAVSERFEGQDSFLGRPLIEISELPRSYPPESVECFVAIGYRDMNRHRMRIAESLVADGYTLATFIHPNVNVWDNSRIGMNVFIFEDNTLQPFTRIGDGSVLWSGNHIGHHSEVGRYAFIASHVVISGSCRIGDGVFIGVNATLHDGVAIGDFALVGAGALVSRDVPDRAVVSPAATRPREQTTDEIDF